MSGFQLDVSMSTCTATGLAANGSRLYVLRAVQSSDPSGRPVVWSVTQSFSNKTPVPLPAGLQAYTSFDSVKMGTRIRAASSADIQTGQTLNVGNNAIGTMEPNGIAGTVPILNTTSSPFACGLSGVYSDGTSAPFCAFPLPGENESTITPLDKILLMFSTDSIETGTVLEGPLGGNRTLEASISHNFFAAISPGLLIDMTGTSQASVSFETNQGWGHSGVKAQPVFPNADLVDLLIEAP